MFGIQKVENVMLPTLFPILFIKTMTTSGFGQSFLRLFRYLAGSVICNFCQEGSVSNVHEQVLGIFQIGGGRFFEKLLFIAFLCDKFSKILLSRQKNIFQGLKNFSSIFSTHFIAYLDELRTQPWCMPMQSMYALIIN